MPTHQFKKQKLYELIILMLIPQFSATAMLDSLRNWRNSMCERRAEPHIIYDATTFQEYMSDNTALPPVLWKIVGEYAVGRWSFSIQSGVPWVWKYIMQDERPMVIVGCPLGTILFWDLQTNKKKYFKFKSYQLNHGITEIYYIESHNNVITHNNGGFINLFKVHENRETMECLKTIPMHTRGDIHAIREKDNNFVVYTREGLENTIVNAQLWDFSGKFIQELNVGRGNNRITWNHDKTLAIGHWITWRRGAGKIYRFALHKKWDEYQASKHSFAVLNTKTQEYTTTITVPNHPFLCDSSPRDNTIIIIHNYEDFQLYDMKTGRKKGALCSVEGITSHGDLKFSPCGLYIAGTTRTLKNEAAITIWSTATKKACAHIPLPKIKTPFNFTWIRTDTLQVVYTTRKPQHTPKDTVIIFNILRRGA